MSEILKLINGELNCDGIDLGKAYPRILEAKSECYKKLTEKLSSQPELAELFKKYKSFEDELSAEETSAYLSHGFKHGLLLGLEIKK